MTSRYAQSYAQQAYLSKLLQRAGYAGEVPSFLSGPSAPAADHPLLAWMASHLREEEHLMREADVAQAVLAESLATQKKDEERSTSAAADALLRAFEEANDLVSVPDQQQQSAAVTGSASQETWLGGPALEALDLKLEQLAGERSLYRSQIQELQALETQLDIAQRASRVGQVAVQAAAEQLEQGVASEHNAVSALNAQVNTLLQDLQAVLQDMSFLSQQHSSQWLMLVGSSSKDLYLQQSSHIMELLSQCNLQEQSPLDSFPAAPEPRQAPTPDDPNWLQFNDPFTPSDQEHSSASGSWSGSGRGLDAAEEQHLMRELQRLGEAVQGAEASALRARLEGAQHGAELDALRTLLQQQQQLGGGGGGGRADEAAAAALEREALGLTAEEGRLLGSAVPAALEQVVRGHEAAVLRAHYELQGLVLEEVVRSRAALVCTLLDHLVRHQLVAAVQGAEQREMQRLYETVQGAEQLLGGVLQAANRRCAVYAALSSSSSSSSGGARGRAGGSGSGVPLGSPAASMELAPVEAGSGPPGAVERVERLLGRVLGAGLGGEGGGGQGVVGQLQALRDAGVAALGAVSSKVYEEMEVMVGQSQGAVQATQQLLFPMGTGPASREGAGVVRAEAGLEGGERPGPWRVVLQLPELARTLQELRLAACEMNELINASVAEQAEAHRSLMENQEEVLAERSVLDWFYLHPDRLNAHVAGVEQRLAAMKI